MIDRGNNKTFSTTIYQNGTSTPYNLEGCTVYLYVKRKVTDDNDDAIITLTGTLTEAASGVVEFYILPAHTNSDEAKENLKDNKQYIYEVQVITDDVPVKYYTALRSVFIVNAQYQIVTGKHHL